MTRQTAQAALMWRQQHLKPCSCRAQARNMPSVPPHITTSNFAVPGSGADTSSTKRGAGPFICTGIRNVVSAARLRKALRDPWHRHDQGQLRKGKLPYADFSKACRIWNPVWV